jgi:hypothetical protein
MNYNRFRGFDNLRKEFPDKYPERMGLAWQHNEEIKLLTSVREKKSIEQIAEDHKRTTSAIKCKLRAFAFDYYCENKTIEQIQKYTGLSEEEIKEAIARRKNKVIKEKILKIVSIPAFAPQEETSSQSENGYIYCFINESMPGIVKVGMTNRTPEERLKDANSPDTFKPPLPYKICFAKYVSNPKQKERILHAILEKYAERIHNQREFFRISPEDLLLFFGLIDGVYWRQGMEVSLAT